MSLLDKIRDDLENFIKINIPESEIRSKKYSKMMKFLSKLLFFNKSFMTGYVTTWYPHIYVPKLPWKYKNNLPAIATLAHEWVHLHDRRRLGWLFNFLYMMPQCFFIFGLLAFWNLWFLLFFLFILPIPSPGRAWGNPRHDQKRQKINLPRPPNFYNKKCYNETCFIKTIYNKGGEILCLY